MFHPILLFYFVTQSSFNMEEKDIYGELSAIRNLMERSTKFISLSGLSGILAGIYALIGAYVGYKMIYPATGGLQYRDYYLTDNKIIISLFLVACAVLLISLTTGILLTIKQAKKKGETPWNPISRRLFFNMSIPLVTGGLFILILILKGQYGVIASSCLIFYGLALVAGSQYTFTDVKWLGFCEIVLGLLSILMPGYGIIFWAIGFGVLHIVYGSIMHFKYKQ